MTFITSLELNYLIFRYLQETGFIHSAFTLGCETGLNRMPGDGSLVPPGVLVSFIQKGLQYLQMEVNMNEDGTVSDADFSLMQPMELITKNVEELRQLVKERQKEKEMREAKTKAGKPGTKRKV